MNLNQDLEGRVALLTGGSKGLGAAIAQRLVALGAKVVLADVDISGAALAAELGPRAGFIRLDVTSESDWTAAVESTIGKFGKIDVLINNAGLFFGGLITEASGSDFEKMFRVNQLGVLFGMKAVAPRMQTHDEPVIVNLSSCVGMKAVHNQAAYAATKWAVRGLTRCAAVEFAPCGIRVNSVHPGPILTPMTQAFVEERGDFLRSRIPLGRLGDPADIAEAVAFLVSRRAKYISGAELTVDGGFSA